MQKTGGLPKPHPHTKARIPDEMAKLEKDIAAAEQKMANPDFYAKDPDGFAKTSMAHQASLEKLSEAEEEWLELEMMREEAETS